MLYVVAVAALIAGGYLGYRYGARVEAWGHGIITAFKTALPRS